MTMKRIPRPMFVLVASAGLAGAAQGQPTCDSSAGLGYEIVSLAPLEPGSFSAAALNEHGDVAGRIFADGDRHELAFVWREGEPLRIGSFPGHLVQVQGINDDGVVVGTLTAPGEPATLFLWDSEADVTQLVPTPVEVYANDINEDLLVVGGDYDGLQGFALEAPRGAFHSILFDALPEVGVGTAGAEAVNAAGIVVGAEVVFLEEKGYYVEMPYKWTIDGGIVALPTPVFGFGGRAVDIDDGEDMAGYVLDGFAGKQTALWLDGGRQLLELGSPQNFFVSEGVAINAGDQIAVVAPNDLFGYTRAFIWDDGDFVDLSCFTIGAGFFALRPLDLNDAGEVLVQLGDEQGGTILDIVILRPVVPGPSPDIDGDGVVGVADLVQLILAWGPCGAPCPEDLDQDGTVGVTDLVVLISAWG